MTRDFPRSPGRTQKPISLGEPFICTSEHPWTPDVKGLVLHPDARITDREAEVRECPICGMRWVQGVPQ